MTYCTSCGMYDTFVRTQDNGCCSECGDTEGIIHDDEEGFPEPNDSTIKRIKYLLSNINLKDLGPHNRAIIERVAILVDNETRKE